MTTNAPTNFPFSSFLEKINKHIAVIRRFSPDNTVEAQFEDVDWSDICFGLPKTDGVPPEMQKPDQELDVTNLVNQESEFCAKGIVRYRYQDIDNQDQCFEQDCEIKGRVIQYPFSIIKESGLSVAKCDVDTRTVKFSH